MNDQSLPTSPAIPSISFLRRAFSVAALAIGVVTWHSDAKAGSDNADPIATHHELGLMQGFPPPKGKRVTRGNALFGVPYNRWSYQNMRSFFPSKNIAQSTKPRRLKVAPDGGIDGIKVRRPDGTVANFDSFLRETYTDSYLVIKEDRIVFERYLNGMHADQPHQMMSVTKSFAGLFGLMSVNAGLVSEDVVLKDIIPELNPSSAFGDAVFRHVLDMTASVDFTEDYADPNSGIQQYARVLGLLDANPNEELADSIYTYLPTLKKSEPHKHGEIFYYQTPKTDVVNWVTNRVTGRSFFDQMTELFDAIGAKGETYVLLDKNGTLFAGGGLNATPHNLARFTTMMLNDGLVDGEQVVPLKVIEALEAGANREAFRVGPDGVKMYSDGNWSYRAQWWVRHTPAKKSINAIGVNGQYITIDRARGVAVIKQSSHPVSSDPDLDEYYFNSVDAITTYLSAR